MSISACAVALALCVVAWSGDAPPAAKAAPTVPAPKTVPGDAVATINGEAITRTALIDALLRESGTQMLELLIRQRLVMQEAARRGVSCTDAECEARLQEEAQTQLKVLAKRLGVDDMNELDTRLASANRPIDELRREVERRLRPHVRVNLLAEKMAAAQVQVTDDDLRNLFQDRYGPKAVARQVVLASRAEADEALNRLKAGADFAAVVREKTIDAVSREHGGELPPIPPRGTLGKAAFELRPGQLSDVIKTDDGFHILRLEHFLPGQEVKFEDVRERLREEARQEQGRRRVPELVAELYRKADIKRMWQEEK